MNSHVMNGTFEPEVFREAGGLLLSGRLKWAWYGQVNSVDPRGRKRCVWKRKCLNETHATKLANEMAARFAGRVSLVQSR